MMGDYEACPACVIDAGEMFVVFVGSEGEAESPVP
jgi:hypothetical protein